MSADDRSPHPVVGGDRPPRLEDLIDSAISFLRSVEWTGYQTEQEAYDIRMGLEEVREALAAARGQQRDQALRNRIAGVASSWGNQDVLDPKEVQRVLTFLLSIELCVCGHERAEHIFGEEGTRAGSLSRVGQGDWHRFEVEGGRSDTCENCGTPQPMCLYWKMHGYVACCPECQHRDPDPAPRDLGEGAGPRG